jgi:hypothetical protein
MFKRLFTISLFLVLLSSFLYGQDRLLLRPVGDNVPLKSGVDLREAIKTSGIKTLNGKTATNVFHKDRALNITTSGTLDTLSQHDAGGTFNTNFGMFDANVMAQWFVAPADLIVKAVGLSASDIAETGDNVSIRLMKWGGMTADELAAFTGATVLGYYPQDGGAFHASTGLPEDATGDWVDLSDGAYPMPPWSNDDFDLWSDAGFGWPLDLTLMAAGGGVYDWVEMINLGFEPQVNQGEVFAILAIHNGVDAAQPADGRIGFWSAGTAGGNLGWKYYSEGRSQHETGDWWIREYAWDMVAAVDLIGDRGPSFVDYTVQNTSLDTEDRTIEATVIDDNPSGGAAGVASVELMYSIDGGDFVTTAMSGSEPNFSGTIPGQAAGTDISYYMVATDVNGYTATSPTVSYSVFGKKENVLLVYNGSDYGQGTIEAYWASWVLADYPNEGDTSAIPNDYWDTGAFGAGEIGDIMALYDYVVQLDGSYPNYDLSEAAASFLAAGTSEQKKAYFLSSQDYGCFITGDCSDINFAAGDFQYDYLGLSGIVGQDFNPGPQTEIFGVDGDPVSGWINEYNSANGTMAFYNPTYELGFTNYIDGLAAGDGAVFVTASDGTTTDIPVGVRHSGDTFNAAIITFDYAGCDFRADTSVAEGDDAGYNWFPAVENFVNPFWRWSGIVVGVEDDAAQTPNRFEISQNYPNPFNPATKISYAIPAKSNVSLKVYNLLGQEVATVVNSVQNAGTHEVNFDASQLSSGVYFYTLKAGDFVSTKKMMLLK